MHFILKSLLPLKWMCTDLNSNLATMSWPWKLYCLKEFIFIEKRSWKYNERKSVGFDSTLHIQIWLLSCFITLAQYNRAIWQEIIKVIFRAYNFDPFYYYSATTSCTSFGYNVNVWGQQTHHSWNKEHIFSTTGQLERLSSSNLKTTFCCGQKLVV